VTPEDGVRLLRDPEAPPGTGSIALRALVQPRVEQVLWTVDGAPFRLADAPYTVRWPLAVGEHRIQAQIPYTDIRSQVVRIRVE
jgi:penicillin-binding protein 1C